MGMEDGCQGGCCGCRQPRAGQVEASPSPSYCSPAEGLELVLPGIKTGTCGWFWRRHAGDVPAFQGTSGTGLPETVSFY